MTISRFLTAVLVSLDLVSAAPNLKSRLESGPRPHVIVALCNAIEPAVFYFESDNDKPDIPDSINILQSSKKVTEGVAPPFNLPFVVMGKYNILGGATVIAGGPGSYEGAFKGTVKYGQTGLNCFDSQLRSFTYTPSPQDTAPAFSGETKCLAAFSCTRAEGIDVKFEVSDDTVVIANYKAGFEKPSNMISTAKELISSGGKLCKDGDVSVDIDNTCKITLSNCDDASGALLPKLIDSFGALADQNGAFALSSQKNTHCSGPAYCPPSMDTQMIRLPKRWQALVSNIPPPGSNNQPSIQATLDLSFECHSDMDETMCKVLKGLAGTGALIPIVGPAFGAGALAVDLACS
ncbi:hypothetical protein JX265_004664 [Neoarthrinium moseri]|uniref:Secreted protein n=1 Tax=Neoarthrinium moseri TaxID=1658444 RepID=A0A9P9WPN2_9PEZI|nr:uncharacterized protein JN550_003832 [Neoarthrinium moseri]KAI1872958.1 hypothetical protein JN550_003832 [Neoarthrinium moseri]KAI1874456.1 hypothetical protein JX265_004664 [Neoarthrinium moseri]